MAGKTKQQIEDELPEQARAEAERSEERVARQVEESKKPKEQTVRQRLREHKHIITRQGKEFVLYEGLLDEAHRQGLMRISTTLIQIPHDDNGNMAVVQAEIETAKGTFSGIGDAAPNNVNNRIVPHLIRMAETRAKARALRDGTNIGITSVEELGSFDQEDEEEDRSATSNGRSAPRTNQSREDESAEHQPQGLQPASAPQIRKIGALLGAAGRNETIATDLSMREASAIIDELTKDDTFSHPKLRVVNRATGEVPQEKKQEDAAQNQSEPRTEIPKASPYKQASANQLATIAKLERLLGTDRADVQDMTSAEASDRITELSRMYNESKGKARSA